jgi:copper oxidase (laccase) domain-containing protein
VPGELLAAIGPCVRQCCYEVSLDVSQRFSPSFAKQGDDAGKRKLDLAAANRCQMVDSGVQPDHIFDIGECTVCRAEDFFSYRREPENPGRMISSIERLA